MQLGRKCHAKKELIGLQKKIKLKENLMLLIYLPEYAMFWWSNLALQNWGEVLGQVVEWLTQSQTC